MSNSNNTDRYQALGASAKKDGVHRALNSAGLEAQSGYFAQFCDDCCGENESPSEYRFFLHADGAGTKAIVSYLLYRETGDVSSFRGLAQDALVMNLDDIYCIGAPSKLYLVNTIGRNARLIGDDVLGEIMRSYAELVDTLSTLGISITLCGGETADCGDIVRTIMVDAVMGGRIKVESLISTDNIRPGDAIIGLSGVGRASYEQFENSSIGSNGLTLARHCLLRGELAKKYPEVVDPCTPSDISYAGKFNVTDAADTLGMTVGQALASPTRTYAPILQNIFRELRSEVHGVIHNTGGGQTKCLRFGRGNHYIKDSLFPVPPLFDLIYRHGGVSASEMYQVFNMGHRIEIYAPDTRFETIRSIAAGFGVEAKIVGFVEANSESQVDNKVTIRAEGMGCHTY